VAFIEIDLRSNLALAVDWTAQHNKQLPFSVSQALNATAQGSKFVPGSKQVSMLAVSQEVIKGKLDRPKPQVEKGLRATVASKRKLAVDILPKDRPEWLSSNRYIAGNIAGGNRPTKGWEKALIQAGGSAFPAGTRLVPGPGMEGLLDKFGNVSRSTIETIKAGMSTKYVSGGQNYFAGKPRGAYKGKERGFGIYRRFAGNNRLQAVFIGFNSLTYDRNLTQLVPKMHQRLEQRFGSYLVKLLNRNVQQNLRRQSSRS